ncbi:MAG: hypothetical protein D6744_15985 [Planctomycetota bacterium]|nr:MAG: hypothetical protein D6744_15985 [Planctomycetota bacterium]
MERCAACDAAFEPGDVVHACLLLTDAGYVRRDFCESCGVCAEQPPLAQWRTRRRAPDQPRPAFDRESIVTFFERLSQPETPQQIELRFVLALLLWRKKILQLESTKPGPQGEVWRFRASRRDARHDVVRPDLDDERIETLSEQIEQLLSGACDPPSVAQTPQDAGAADA